MRARAIRRSGAGRRSTALRDTLTPPAGRLLRLFTGLDGGVKLLVDLRADLLRVRRATTTSSRQVDESCTQHLATLFDVGLLTLQRITWDAPASLLEKLIAYEAVHAIDSWTDLKNRLDSDRRCYAFFHPAMPAEPLVFVEIALTTGIATRPRRRCSTRHAPDLDPEHADTAVFYSISNCQPGLAGREPRQRARSSRSSSSSTVDLPHVQRFVTLSPIPGLPRAGSTSELRADDALGRANASCCPPNPTRVLRPARRRRLGDRRSDQARAARALRRATSTTAQRRPRRSIRSPTSTSRTARRSSGSTGSPIRARPVAPARPASWRTTSTSPTRIAERAERVRTATSERRRDRRAAIATEPGTRPNRVRPVEKLVYLIWDRPSRDARRRPQAVPRRHRAAAARRSARAVCEVRPRRRRRAGADDGSGPDDELPVRAVRDRLGRHSRRARRRTRRCSPRPASGGRATSSPSRCTRDYGDNEHAPRATGPTASAPPASSCSRSSTSRTGMDDETFYGHWYGHQSPMSEWMQPRCRYVRNAVVRSLTPGAPRYKAIVAEAWPTRRALLTDLPTFFGAPTARRSRRTHPHHARQHQAALRPRDDAQLHALASTSSRA